MCEHRAGQERVPSLTASIQIGCYPAFHTEIVEEHISRRLTLPVCVLLLLSVGEALYPVQGPDTNND